jgi:hypothetical protein
MAQGSLQTYPWVMTNTLGSIKHPGPDLMTQGTRSGLWSKGPMGHVPRTQVALYVFLALSSNHHRNMLLLIAGDIWYPKVQFEEFWDPPNRIICILSDVKFSRECRSGVRICISIYARSQKAIYILN